MNSKTIKGKYLDGRNAYVMNKEPMAIHCHHYNCFLQYSIESAKSFIDSCSILTNSAQEVVFSQFLDFFKENELSYDEKIRAIASQHEYAGFGSLDLSSVSPEGGIAISRTNHYAEGWLSKFGNRKKEDVGVAFFSTGYIAGALDAIDGQLGRFTATQTKCKTKGDLFCEFKITKNPTLSDLEASPQEGQFTDNIQLLDNPTSEVNYAGIREALTEMKIEGDKEGMIPAFGVSLTRMYTNYYGLISNRFLIEMEYEVGHHGIKMVEDLLVEAGHVCVFNTFGGIMESAEWYGLVYPMLKNREDWVHGIIACANALGWGHIEIRELIPGEKLVLRVKSGYENNMYLEKYGEAQDPRAFLMTGAVAGIMNLLYHGDITTKPALNTEYYEATFKSPGKFDGKQTLCRSMGDEFDEFVAIRSEGRRE